MNCVVAVATPSITRATIASRSTASASARRTRASRNGLRGSGRPSLSVAKGEAPSRRWSKDRYTMRRLSTSDSATASFRRSRSMSLVGTWSMMSTSPASSAAVRAASLVTMR